MEWNDDMINAPKTDKLDEFIRKELEDIKKVADSEESVKTDWNLLNNFFIDQVIGK